MLSGIAAGVGILFARWGVALRRRTREIVPVEFITNIATVRQLMDESLLIERLLSILASLFGGLALLLAAVGLYGIVSFSVIRRTREIGVRIAMGAQRGTVLWMILRNTAGLAAVGLALGIPLVFLAKKYIDSELFGLHADDPLTIAGAMSRFYPRHRERQWPSNGVELLIAKAPARR